MPMHPFHRTELLLGGDGWRTLQQSAVAVIGLGGVGSYAAEALVRAGVGHLTLVDFDKVCITNVNRQLHSVRSTVGKDKVTLMAARCSDINPKAEIRGIHKFFSLATADEILDRPYDYVLDCIDNMTAKVVLIERCVRSDLRVIAAMGAGGRLDPTRVRVSDLCKTHTDPLARIVRDLLRQRGITTGVECVWSDEPPNTLDAEAQAAFRCICPNRSEKDKLHSCEGRLQVQGSVSWIPAMFGLAMSGTVVNRLVGRPVHEADRPRRRTQRMSPAPGKPSIERKKALLEEAGWGRTPREPAEADDSAPRTVPPPT